MFAISYITSKSDLCQILSLKLLQNHAWCRKRVRVSTMSLGFGNQSRAHIRRNFDQVWISHLICATFGLLWEMSAICMYHIPDYACRDPGPHIMIQEGLSDNFLLYEERKTIIQQVVGKAVAFIYGPLLWVP